jgi:serine/threonine-protein kinase
VVEGSRLGPYDVLALIGAGGMGEVYRARDSRLGRDVAIKTLPSGLAADAERLKRFELEARAASQLSHPNILTIFDIGTTDGHAYIVSELLEGENLRERLTKGALPQRRVVEIGGAMASALAAAHARGIVHRDLKPENLFLTRDGRIKILDFGIAKLTQPDGEKPSAAATVTIMTDVGSAVGTLGYMAPEQMRGEPVDHRADIFAFGAVLHELLAGSPAFRQDSRIATVNAVLESDPPALPETVAPAIRRIIARCVEKNPDERFQSARDLAFALTALSDVVPTVSGDVPHRARRWTIDWRIAVVAVLVAAAGAGSLAWTLRPSPPSAARSVKRFVVPPGTASVAWLEIAPDGTRVVYAGGTGPQFASQLYVRSFDDLTPRVMPGTDGARMPFLSPDGQWVAFEAGAKLKKVPVAGGAAVTICDVGSMLEGSWGSNGQIVIAQREQGLKIVSAEGGVPQDLTSPDATAGEIDHHAPHFLPGGRAILFTIHAGPEVFRVAVRSLETGVQRTIIDDGFNARYVPSGHLVYGRADMLLAAPFDVTRLEITGPSLPVVENVATRTQDGQAVFSVAADGTLAYLPAVARDGRSLTWVDRKGVPEELPTLPKAYDYPALSPDGKHLAVQISDGAGDNIFVYELATDLLSRVTRGGAESRPVWSADGKRLTYAARRKEERHILSQPVDGSVTAQSLLAVSGKRIWPAAWTPDDGRLLFVESPPTNLDDIKVLDVAHKTPPTMLVASPAKDAWPHLSPDGKWIVYATFDNPGYQLFVQSLVGGTPRQITTDGGTQPRWAHSGREIFYRVGRRFMRIAVETTPSLVVGKPELLFEGQYLASADGPANYDVTPDDQRFVLVKLAPDELASRSIHIVQNFFEELTRRVPVPR